MINELTMEYREARQALDAICLEISKRGKAGVVAVCDAHGELIALARMDGAPFSSITIAMNKAYSAARERKPSEEIGNASRNARRASISVILATRDLRDGAAGCPYGKTAK